MSLNGDNAVKLDCNGAIYHHDYGKKEPSKLRRVLGRILYRDLFGFWESLGFHVTRNYFYEPIPDTKRLRADLWATHSELVGIDLRENEQLELLSEFVSHFRNEYGRLPVDKGFASVDATILYCMIRRYKPRRIIEVGSGFSTLICAQAILKNIECGNECELVSIDPYPDERVKSIYPSVVKLVQREVQETPISTFTSLGENDVLFIDSSHVLRIGGDVKYLYLEVLPRLQRGVLVHAHDVFLPSEYPKDWVLVDHRFWTEQYILQAFLTLNPFFEVLWAGNYMHVNHPDKLANAIMSYRIASAGSGPGSFWIRRSR